MSTDVNIIRLALYYHEEDLAKMNGIWPQDEKPKMGADAFKRWVHSQGVSK